MIQMLHKQIVFATLVSIKDVPTSVTRMDHPSIKTQRSPIAKTLALLRSAYRHAMDEGAIRQTTRELEQLDDHSLKDIGLKRYEIESEVMKRRKARR